MYILAIKHKRKIFCFVFLYVKEVYTGYQTQKKNSLLCFSVRERGIYWLSNTKKNILLCFSVRERGEVYTGYKTQKKNILLCFSVRERGIYWLSNRKEKKNGSLLYSVNLSAEFAHAASVPVHPVCAFSWLLSHHGY